MEGLKPSVEDRTDSWGGRRPSVAPADSGAARGVPDPSGDRQGGDGGGVRGSARVAGPPRGPEASALHGRVDPAALERFRLESRSAAQLHHGNIVPVHGMGEHLGVYFYAMQYIRGHGLDVVLADLRRLKEGAVEPGPQDEGSMSVARSLLTGGLGAAALRFSARPSRRPRVAARMNR